MNDAPHQSTGRFPADFSTTVLAALRRMDLKLDRLLRAVKHHDMKADGEVDALVPWMRLDYARRTQIEAVRSYLRDHRGGDPKHYTIIRACRETFKPLRRGYPSVDALRAYCYALPITDFV